MKKILIFGATGFIGRELTKYLQESNEIYVISRNPDKAKKVFNNAINIINWDFKDVKILSEVFSSMNVIVNLAGENIAAKLWTKNQKQKILNSRIDIGKLISEAIVLMNKKPELLIQASAIGYYGYNSNENCNENSPKGKGFLAEVTEKWENSTKELELHGVKRIIIRTGVVMGVRGGIFPKLVKPVKLFLGSNFGEGNNCISWIHIKDEIRAIGHLINNESSKGIYNLVSSQPIQSKHLNQIIGKLLKRPIWFRIPKKILYQLFGKMAYELLLADQKVYSSKFESEGFNFLFSNAEDAVADLIKKL